MPFAQLVPRAFHERGIGMYAPATPGVIGISNAREWLVVAQTGNIREALYECLRGGMTGLTQAAPTGYVFEMCEWGGVDRREAQLKAEYKPRLEVRR